MDKYAASRVSAQEKSSLSVPVFRPCVVQTFCQWCPRLRYDGEAHVRASMEAPDCVGLLVRFIDRCGDNGIIAIVIGKRSRDDVVIDTRLMTVRVIGRQVEEAALGLIVDAGKHEAERIPGEYFPTNPFSGI